jgi:hypothetical protein
MPQSQVNTRAGSASADHLISKPASLRKQDHEAKRLDELEEGDVVLALPAATKPPEKSKGVEAAELKSKTGNRLQTAEDDVEDAASNNGSNGSKK